MCPPPHALEHDPLRLTRLRSLGDRFCQGGREGRGLAGLGAPAERLQALATREAAFHGEPDDVGKRQTAAREDSVEASGLIAFGGREQPLDQPVCVLTLCFL